MRSMLPLRRLLFPRSTNQCLKKTLFGLLGFVAVLIFNIMFNKPVFHYFKNMNVKGACALPKFDIFDSTISEFFWDVTPIQCAPEEPLMYIDSNGFLQVNQTVKTKNGYSDLNCTCQPILPQNDDIIFGPAFQCTSSTRISTDFYYAKCSNKNVQVYDGLLDAIDDKTTRNNKKLMNESSEQLSIYLYGYDAMSNLIARRTMPATLQYLEEILDAYTFKGYTKVGDNTWPNLGAMLTGNRSDQSHKTLNEATFIWERLSDKGYATMLGEDYPHLTCFRGFLKQPTDHYAMNLYIAADKQKVINRDLRKIMLFMEYKNIKLGGDSSYLCIGNKPKHKILIDYYKKFMNNYKNLRKFGMTFNTELGHDYINFYKHADEDSVEFFQWMHDNGHLDNAVLILYSDHGPRYSEIQNTNIGRVTSMMPIFSMYVPKHLKQKYPQIHENLVKNTERLTTAFDIHQTFVDILNGKFDHNDVEEVGGKGISLFRPISSQRSCFEADIPEHYCPCYTAENIPTNAKGVEEMGLAVVSKINAILHKHSECAKLKLGKVIKASRVKSNFQRDKSMEERFSIRSFMYSDNQDTRNLLIIETVPGNARFEATVHSGSRVEVSGEISRVNRYGNQADCMKEKKLRIYCYCQ